MYNTGSENASVIEGAGYSAGCGPAGCDWPRGAITGA
jgi:hypothetical protein